MKNKTLLLTLSLLALVGCSGTNSSSVASSLSEATSSEKASSSEATSGYEAYVKNEDGSLYEGTCYVKWCTDENCFMPVKLVDGYAYNKTISKKEDATYYVHIDQLDAAYTYDPNIQATPENKSVTITVYEIKELIDSKVTTGVYYANVKSEGTEITIDATNKGTYTIESWVDYGAQTSPDTTIDPTISQNGALLDDNSGYSNNFKASIQTTDADEIKVVLGANKDCSYYFIVTYTAA